LSVAATGIAALEWKDPPLDVPGGGVFCKNAIKRDLNSILGASRYAFAMGAVVIRPTVVIGPQVYVENGLTVALADAGRAAATRPFQRPCSV
jgi:hypothetical protein